MGGGFLHVDRPIGNPNIETGAGLFAGLVKEGGSHVGGPVKEPEGVRKGGREEGLRYEKMVGGRGEVCHGRWASSHKGGIHSWTTCLRKKVSGMLAYLLALGNPKYFRTWECKETL